MNQYRCIVVECCGKCIHSAFRSPTEQFCNRERPYWTLRLDQWSDGISSCCTLPTYTDFQSEREKVLELLEDLRKYANGEYKEADLSDNEHDLRIHLEYENRIWGIMKELRQVGSP